MKNQRKCDDRNGDGGGVAIMKIGVQGKYLANICSLGTYRCYHIKRMYVCVSVFIKIQK